MKNIFLISDPHFGHANICKFNNNDGTKLRPWDDVSKMDEDLITNWNNVVSKEDKTYILGDVVINKKNLPILDLLNGSKTLIRGNHDIFDTKLYMKYFKQIHGIRVLEDMVLTHVPLHPDSVGNRPRWATNVHGHTHSYALPDPKYFCVCVEQINYTPIHIEELRKQIKIKKEKYIK
jgi:calcineurin-like phosphoesterase family protein